MRAQSDAGWEHHADGQHISVPIDPANLDEVRVWCSENCEGAFLIVVNRRVVFQSREDAGFATLFWRCEER